jgi:hypothetical protein
MNGKAWWPMLWDVQTCRRASWPIKPFSSHLIPPEVSSFPCLASYVVVLSSAKLIFNFANFKMVATATGNKKLNVLKQWWKPLNASHRPNSNKNLRLVLDWMIKTFPAFRKDKESVTDEWKLQPICQQIFKMKHYSLKTPMWHKQKERLRLF